MSEIEIEVRMLLNEKLDGRWIGRWPVISPDLTPLDFIIWGFMKNHVYAIKICDIAHLKDAITREAKKINEDKDFLQRVCSSVTKRVQECINVDGEHFQKYC